MKTYVITLGDPDGIGAEVAAKALRRIPPISGARFVVMGAPGTARYFKRMLPARYAIEVRRRLSEALNPSSSHRKLGPLVVVESPSRPANWVRESAELAMVQRISAVITGPMSKSRRTYGHTEILSEVSGRKRLFMAFLGRRFNLALATGHIPLRSVCEKLSAGLIEDCVRSFRDLLLIAPRPFRRPGNRSIGILGLNPHSGERGLLGHEEVRWLSTLVQKLHREGLGVTGPLVPDAAFTPNRLSMHSGIVALYHDQGLIPFKALHGFDEGVHVTLGLPFVRTSVDHGTAKDIFGLNRANAGSMRDAILTAVALTRRKI